MAHSGSPQDLFASEESDSDATVDLSESRQPADTYQVVAVSASDSDSNTSMSLLREQNDKQRSARQCSKHTISSSDSEDDGRHNAACLSPKVITGVSGLTSNCPPPSRKQLEGYLSWRDFRDRCLFADTATSCWQC